jgi:uncharacterized small protein (DUF1192 family)
MLEIIIRIVGTREACVLGVISWGEMVYRIDMLMNEIEKLQPEGGASW